MDAYSVLIRNCRRAKKRHPICTPIYVRFELLLSHPGVWMFGYDDNDKDSRDVSVNPQLVVILDWQRVSDVVVSYQVTRGCLKLRLQPWLV